MHVKTANTRGNPGVGMYAFASDAYCILGPEAAHLEEDLKEVLGVPIVVTTIAGTSLAGVFLAGNSNALIVPSIIFEHERRRLEEAGITVFELDTTHTALGNNIVATDAGCLAGPMFSEKDQKALSEALRVPVHQFTVAGVEVVGSSIVATRKGGLIHRDASTFEHDMAKDTLQLPKLLPGTVNFGVPYVRAGIVANSNGFLIGSASGGPEIANADEALGFIEG